MDNRRLSLHNMLKEILGSDNVYYQPPESVRIKYPAIVYSKRLENVHADSTVYYSKKIYKITVIDPAADSITADRIAELPTCRFDRSFTSENLYHHVFEITY